MTLDQFADTLAASADPTPGRVQDLTRIAIQLRDAGVRLSLENLADKASLCAWAASAKWERGREADLAEELAGTDAGREAIYKAVALALAEGSA